MKRTTSAYNRRSSVLDDDDLDDFDKFMELDESSDEEFSSSKSKATVVAARLNVEVVKASVVPPPEQPKPTASIVPAIITPIAPEVIAQPSRILEDKLVDDYSMLSSPEMSLNEDQTRDIVGKIMEKYKGKLSDDHFDDFSDARRPPAQDSINFSAISKDSIDTGSPSSLNFSSLGKVEAFDMKRFLERELDLGDDDSDTSSSQSSPPTPGPSVTTTTTSLPPPPITPFTPSNQTIVTSTPSSLLPMTPVVPPSLPPSTLTPASKLDLTDIIPAEKSKQPLIVEEKSKIANLKNKSSNSNNNKSKIKSKPKPKSSSISTSRSTSRGRTPSPSPSPSPSPTKRKTPPPTGKIDSDTIQASIDENFSKFMQMLQKQALPVVATPVSTSVPVAAPLTPAPALAAAPPTPVDGGSRATSPPWKEREAKLLADIEELKSNNKKKLAELQDAQQSNFVLNAQLKDAATLREKIREGATPLKDPKNVPSKEELGKIERDIKEQEVILQGYQKENEKLVAELKDAKARLRGAEARMFKENQALQAEVRALQDQLASRPLPGTDDARDMALLRQSLEKTRDEANRREAEAQVRESELRMEIERLRKEKKELEAKMGGVDLKAVQEEHGTVKRLEALRAEDARRFAEETDALKERLKWYAENQELISKNDGRVRELENTVRELQDKLSKSKKTSPSPSTSNNASNANNSKRVKELEKKIHELEEALRSKNPNSIAQLIRAAKEDNPTIVALQDALRKAHADAAGKEETMEAGIRALRQEYEAMKTNYEKRIKALQDMNSNPKPKLRIKELEAQLESVRNTYKNKIKDLEQRLDPRGTAASAKSKATAGNLKSGRVAISADTNRLKRIKDLESEIAKKDDEIKMLREHQGENAITAVEDGVAPRNIEYEQQLRALRRENEALRAKESMNPAGEVEAEMQRLYTQLQASEMTRMAIQENSNQLVRQAHTETLELQAKLRGAESEVKSLRERTSHPGHSKIAALEAQITSMEERHRQRERELSHLSSRTNPSSEDAQSMKDKYHQIIKRKNEEISRFRAELDAMLNAMEQLRTNNNVIYVQNLDQR